MHLVRLAPNSKVPPKGEYQISDDPAVHEKWIKAGSNVGILMKENNRVVVDFDRDIDAARAHYRQTLCNAIVMSKRGPHFHYEGETQTRKFEYGDIKGSGYCLYPPSVVDGHEYRFLRNGELQPFPEHLFPDERKEITKKIIKDVRSYISKIESIQGQNGSGGLVRAIARCRDAGLSQAEATIEILEWNAGPTVAPPWDHKSIARAITRVYSRESK